MPHSTNNYIFEMRVAEAAHILIESQVRKNLFPLDKIDGPAVIYFDENGNAGCRPMMPEEVHLVKDEIQGSELSYILRDPFAEEYMWLEWNHISRSLIESILGVEMNEKEFINFRDNTVKEFPESWSVMF